jgi:acyl dehydratase
MTEQYLEDFTVGQAFVSGRLRIDEEQIRRFASEFDPQPFHLDHFRTLPETEITGVAIS